MNWVSRSPALPSLGATDGWLFRFEDSEAVDVDLVDYH